MDRFGLSVALLTPFHRDGGVDFSRLSKHANQVLSEGAGSVTLFGTTGEGASLDRSERLQGLRALMDSGIPADKIILGVFENSVGDVVSQIEQALLLNVDTFLLSPPYFFSGCSEAGISGWYEDVFKQTDSRAKFILYNIPQMTGVYLSLAIVRRLHEVAGRRVVAVKDSSGDWAFAQVLLTQQDVQVLIGDERLLHKSIKLGGGGAISGMANIYAARMKVVIETATEDAALSAEVSRLVALPIIPAIKATIALHRNDPEWEFVRAPLTELDASEREVVQELWQNK